MADQASDKEKNKTAETAETEIDHAQANEFPADDVGEKMSGEKAEQRDDDIDKNGKDVAAGDQMEQAAVKR